MKTAKVLIGTAAACLTMGAFAAENANVTASAGARGNSAQESGMKIKIFCDMEGISGILAKSQVTHDHPRYAEGQRCLMGDLNACIQGCFSGGAAKVTVQDIHSTCRNIVWDELDGRAACIAGPTSRFQGIEEFDGLILLGYHAMAGTPNAILAHTSSHAWKNFWMNGEKAGEFAFEAARAGEHGVPVIMASGDDKFCREAKALISEVVAVEVKTGAAFEAGTLLPKTVAHQKIRQGAEEAVRKLRVCKPKPYVLSSPVTVRLEWVERPALPGNPAVKIIDARTYEVTGENAEKAINMLF
ncbi:MAG: M55 family metallopeptidase [Kiritimatiellae bacterium]|nr:M55 family metallopeptidase [Kiritimatiellia bacterium]